MQVASLTTRSILGIWTMGDRTPNLSIMWRPLCWQFNKPQQITLASSRWKEKKITICCSESPFCSMTLSWQKFQSALSGFFHSHLSAPVYTSKVSSEKYETRWGHNIDKCVCERVTVCVFIYNAGQWPEWRLWLMSLQVRDANHLQPHTPNESCVCNRVS